MKFLPGMLEFKKAPASGVIARATGGSQTASSGSYAVSNWDVEKAVRFYELVLWAFRCTDVIASAQADIPIVVRRGDPNDGPIREYKNINQLLNVQSNPYEDAWMFRYRLSSQGLLSRRGVFVECLPDKEHAEELHLLPPNETEPIPDPKKFVKGFKVRRSDWQEDELSPEQVIWIRLKPHPIDPYLQMTPMMAAGLDIETDYLAKLFNRNFLANDGRPGLLVSIKGQLSQEDALEIKRRFTGGYAAAGMTTVIESDGIDVEDLAASPRDLQWDQLLAMTKENILQAYGTPESVLGDASGRTFDNADAEWEMFYKGTVKGHCNAITRPMDILTGSTTDDDRVVHDWSKVDVLQRQEEARREKAATRVAQGLATVDDYLREAGQQPLDVPFSRVYYHPGSGVLFGKNPKDVEEAAKAPQIGGQIAANQQAQAGQEAASRRGALNGVQQGQRSFENIIAARAMRLSKHNPVHVEEKMIELPSREHPYNDRRTKMEGFIEGALQLWTDRQVKVIGERLEHVKSRKGTRHWDGTENGTTELKALDPKYAVEVGKWAGDLKSSLEGYIRKQARYEANRVARDVADTGVLDVILSDGEGNPAGKSSLDKLVGGGKVGVQDQIDATLKPVYDIIEKAATRQTERVSDMIRQLDADGASLSQIKSEIRSAMGNRSTWQKNLSTTVTTAAMEGVKTMVYGHAAPYVQKTWQSTDDERTRYTHYDADGQVRAAHRPFSVGGSKMMFPGDPTAPIEETANCRCWLDWSVRAPAKLSGRKTIEEDTVLERT